MSVEVKRAIERALKSIVAYRDMDIFPFTFESTYSRINFLIILGFFLTDTNNLKIVWLESHNCQRPTSARRGSRDYEGRLEKRLG